jgi:PAS domain S-box-containing protein
MKKARDLLRETQAILNVAMNSSSAGIAIADAPDGVLRYVNDAGLLILGGDRQRLVDGVGIHQYVASWHLLDLDGRPLKSDEVPLTRAILLGETCSRKFIIRRAPGDDRIVMGNAAPIKDENGKIQAGIVVFLDITESSQAENALQKANELCRLATVVHDAHDAITVQDLEGRILAWNPGAVRMYGWSEAEALAMNVRERIPKALRKDALAKIHLLSQAEIFESYRTQRLAKDGAIVEVSIISTALVNDAGEVYAIATTERGIGN